MAGDYTRNTFRPENEHAAVLAQQGRVVVDADWNTLWELLDRRLSVETVDILGRCRVPRQTKDAFLITPVGGDLQIGTGRAYVDGIQVHNRGTGTVTEEPVWDEPAGSDPVSYLGQPYLFGVAMPTSADRYVAYLDVWRREITAVEDDRLIDPAIGVDTTTRLQTIWQVRLLGIDEGVECGADWDAIQAWEDATGRSGARLTTRAVGTPAATDPCLIPPQGGYRGIENRIYRVEIHDGSTPSAPGTGATFKWSRSNVSVAARITGPIQDPGSAPKVPVDVIGRDGILRFTDGDVVEILDDAIELAGRPGYMARIKVDGVDAARSVLTLDAAFTGTIDVNRNPRIRKWDQRTGLTNGVLPVAPNTLVELEDGVEIEFGVGDTGFFHSGDYWIFATRTADASVELLDEARPRGIRHHYCRLAILELPAGGDAVGQRIADCRDLWPPEDQAGGCDCDACVTAPDGDATELLQRAIDELHDAGGKLCLGPGLYRISQPLRVLRAVSLRITGKGWRTVIAHAGRGPAFLVDGSANVTIEDLTVAVVPGREPAPAPAPGEEEPRIAPVEERRGEIYEVESTERAATAAFEERMARTDTGTYDGTSADARPVEVARQPATVVDWGGDPLANRGSFAAIVLRNCVDVTVRRCVVIAASLPDAIVASTSLSRGSSGTRLAYGSLGAVLSKGLGDVGTGILLAGILVHTRIEGNVFIGGTAVKTPTSLTRLAAEETGSAAPAEEPRAAREAEEPAAATAAEDPTESSGVRSTSYAATMTQYTIYAVTAGLTVEDNAIACVVSGIDLHGFTFQLADTQIARNTILGCARASIIAAGIVPGSWLGGGTATSSLASGLLRSRLDVRGNTIQTLGHGILVGVDEARIADNDVGSIPFSEERVGTLLREFGGYERGLVALEGGHGIGLVTGLDLIGIDRCQVLGNRLVGVRGDGIHLSGRVASGMVKQNVIQDPGGGGIVMATDAQADTLTIENNQVLGAAPRSNTEGSTLTGIQLVNVVSGEVSSNTVAGLGRQATNVARIAGIRVLSRASGSTRIAGNDVSEIGPHADGVGQAYLGRAVGIEVAGAFDRTDVVDNSVRRSRTTPTTEPVDTRSQWHAIEIRGGLLKRPRGLEELEVEPLENAEYMVALERVERERVETERAAVDARAATDVRTEAETESRYATLDARRIPLASEGVGEEMLVAIGGYIRKLPRGREITAARGNLMDGYGTGSSLRMEVGGAATATDNRATLHGSGTSVLIRAGAIIAATNYVVGPSGSTPIALGLPTDAPFTVLGNISSGPIEVNGTPLASSAQGAPFAPLNVSAT